MAIFLILISLLFAISPAKKDSIKPSLKQAEYYLSQIESKSDDNAELWALSLLGSENEEVRSYLKHNIAKTTYSDPKITLFQNFEEGFQRQLKKVVLETGSADLLIGLLLATKSKKQQEKIFAKFDSDFDLPDSKIDYSALITAIINKESITNEILPNSRFYLAHFLLLYDSEHSSYFSKKYREAILKKWQKDLKDKIHSLKPSLRVITYFRVLYLENKYSEVLEIYNYLDQDSTFPNSSLRLRIYRYLDFSMNKIGYYDKSLEIVRNWTLPLAKKYASESTIISIKIYQGTYLYSIGKVKEARDLFEKIISEADNKNIPLPETIIYNNLALAYYKNGQYEKYLEKQFQALETSKKENNYDHRLEVYNNLFVYYRKTNDEDNALNYLEKARALAQQENKTYDLGTIYMLTGSFYREFKKDFSLAHDFFDKAAKILDRNKSTNEYLELLNEEAETFENQKKFKLARNKYNQILKITPANNPNYIEALINKALIEIKVSNIAEAKSLINNFNSHDLGQLDFEQVIKAKTVEANYLDKTGHPDKAIKLLAPALEQIVARARNSSDLKSGFWHVEDEYLDAFELTVALYLETDQPEMAVQQLDRLKTINDASFYQNPLVKSSVLNESELTQYKQLTSQLDATRKRLLTAPADREFEIRQTISRLKLKKRNLDKKLTNRIDTSPISIREIQNRLSAHQMVMHITELKDQFYLAKITRSNINISTIPLDEDLRNRLSHSLEQVATHKTNLDSLYSITKLLGLKDIPQRINQLTMIPDSYFYQLPVDILPLNKPTHSYSYGEVTYVIEQFRTHYLTSLDDFEREHVSNPRPNPLNFAGYGVSEFNRYQKKPLVPLPYASREVLNIADTLTHLSHMETFINNRSTKPTFMQTAPQASILHLATHSEVSDRDPMFSTIYMSKTGESADSTFDDQIFAYELFELNLNNEMIMLNSCESGSGSYIQGTGVMGISRALRYAGANSLILNLWSVNDMLASDFAVHFYDQLNKGKSKAEALQATKQYFLRTKNASPHFWGPYMLIGNADPIVHPNQTENYAMAGTFILYFLLMVIGSFLAEKGVLFTSNKKSGKAA